MEKKLLTNATVVLEHETVHNLSVLIENGQISAFDPLSTAGAEIINLQGKTLIPGLIDLHCDALEKEIEARPGVYFSTDFGCAQADKNNAAAGITTIFHSLSFTNRPLGIRNNKKAAEIVGEVHNWQKHALVDNRVHIRYEISDFEAPAIIGDLIEKGYADLLSFMNHNPGQGQYRDVRKYLQYLQEDIKDKSIEVVIKEKTKSIEGCEERMAFLTALADKHGVLLASHDDDTLEKVEFISKLGGVISEFPINVETAQAACDKGLATLFGAPNVLRGQSHSGNMRAIDAIKEGVASCLCSDYSPASLLPAAFKLPSMSDLSLSEAMAMVSVNPAKAMHLDDRGTIALGKRADLVAVSMVGGIAQAEQVWVNGSLVFALGYKSVANG